MKSYQFCLLEQAGKIFIPKLHTMLLKSPSLSWILVAFVHSLFIFKIIFFIVEKIYLKTDFFFVNTSLIVLVFL